MILRTIFFSIVAVTLVFFLGACGEDGNQARINTSVRTETVPPPVANPPAGLVASQEAFIDVYARVSPAVVNVSATRIQARGGANQLFEQFFGELYKQRQPPVREEVSLGSGFIISDDGFILTNEHVVRQAEELRVRLSDGRILPAAIVGSDPQTDVAVIRVKADGKLPTTVLGDSDRIRVGEWALAIGNPFGLEGTLTIGVISATERANLGIEEFENFIQTDASINPGNSGGPLLNIHGEVVGINTAIVASGQGIGFAIPINLARLVADQLIETGGVTRGWLGVSIQPLTPELAESFGLDRASGVLVNRVLPGTPAEESGLQRGDIILQVNGKDVRGVRELQVLVASAPVGRELKLALLRDGQEMELTVTVAVRDDDSAAASAPAAEPETLLGLTVGPAADGGGVLVREVDPQSDAAAAGVVPGDVILSLNRNDTPDVGTFNTLAGAIGAGDHVVLLVRRGETTLYLAFTVS